MPFQIVRNDITAMEADAIVNTANPRPVIGSGTDAMIHAAAGPRLLQARQKIGDIAPGTAAVTAAYDLRAKYVIHTVGPVWLDGNHGEEAILRSCYDSCLRLALKKGCKSIAFPLISTGNYGFPKDKALQTAIAAFSAFLTQHDMQIYLVVFDRTAYRLSEQLFQSVASYIDQHYVDACEKEAFRYERQTLRGRAMPDMAVCEACCAPAPAKSASLEDFLKQADAGFSETLLKLIDKIGKKDSDIYKKANVSKQHFSKIRNNPAYKPTKATALAFAIALELDLAQTRDLIGRAGYALTASSKFDLILQFFIEQKNYNIVQINCTLYEFDQPLLGA